MTENVYYKGSASGAIQEHKSSLRPLTSTEVLVAIHHSGFCGTDLMYSTGDLVLGHEGAGVVAEVGSNVHALKKGDRVGFGYLHDSCGWCDQCLSDQNLQCEKSHKFGFDELDQGGFAHYTILPESAMIPIPDGMSTSVAAPLMCAGMTVWSVLERYVKPTDRVGVYGIGALGHLAIQFAKKMGCEVVAFSGSESKKEDALALGATEFVATSGKEKLELAGGKLNHLILSANMQPDFALYLPLMAPFSSIHPLSLHGTLQLPAFPLVVGNLSVRGSTSGGPGMVRRMLQFAQRNDIKAVNEIFPLSSEGVQEAHERMRKSDARFKIVFETLHATA